MDELPLALDQLLQKVDRVALEGCKVRMALNSQESVPRGWVSKGAATYTSRFERNLEANILAVTCCLARSSPSSTILDESFILIKISNSLTYTQCCKDIFWQENSFSAKQNSSSWNQDLSCFSCCRERNFFCYYYKNKRAYRLSAHSQLHATDTIAHRVGHQR